MKRTGLERTDRQGVAGTEWRMQIGGERLGRAGIEVAGTERTGGLWSGLESPVLDRSGKAGEERLGEVGCGLQRQDAAG